METAIIYVFSGTYNTLTTAHMISEFFELHHVKAIVYEIKRPFQDVPEPDKFDYVGFGYPVHAYNSPQIFLQFVRELPVVSYQKAFIFKTSGEPFRFNDASSCKLYRLLRRKGFDVILEKHLLMPYNIMFRYPDALVKQMYLYSQAMSKQLVIQMLRGERDMIRYHIRHRIVSFVFRIQWLGAKLNSFLYSVDENKCTLCMRCINSCPLQNIYLMDGNLKFASHCAMCMRCSMFCPTNAINIGFLHFWKLNGAYDFKKVLADDSIDANFVHPETKGYFKLFNRYYRRTDASLAEYHIYVAGKYQTKKIITEWDEDIEEAEQAEEAEDSNTV